MSKQVKSQYVVFDYEPWNWPEQMGFSPEAITKFGKEYNLPKGLTPELILKKYRKQWTMFWLDISHGMTRTMAQAARAAVPDIKIISYTYLWNYDNKKILWAQFENCPKDPRREAKIVNELMFSVYHIHGKKLVNAIRMSKRHIQNTDISVIEALSQHTKYHPWVNKKDALSPQRIYQNMILYAAMGIKRVVLYPGLYIDGAFYTAMGKASRLIWAHEKFFYKGKNVRSQIHVSVTTANENPPEQSAFAYTAQLHHGQVLVSLFNFTDQPLQFTIENSTDYQTVAGHGVKLLELKVNEHL